MEVSRSLSEDNSVALSMEKMRVKSPDWSQDQRSISATNELRSLNRSWKILRRMILSLRRMNRLLGAGR